MRQRAQSRRRVRRGNNKTWSYHSTEPWQHFSPRTLHRSQFLALIKKGAPAFLRLGVAVCLFFIIIIVYLLPASKVLAFASQSPPPRSVCSGLLARLRSQFPATAIQSCDKLKRCSFSSHPLPHSWAIAKSQSIASHRFAAAAAHLAVFCVGLARELSSLGPPRAAPLGFAQSTFSRQ